MTVKNLVMVLVMTSMVFAGCISDLTPFGGEHVGNFDIDTLGTGTAEWQKYS